MQHCSIAVLSVSVSGEWESKYSDVNSSHRKSEVAWESFVTSAEWALAEQPTKGPLFNLSSISIIYLRILSRYPQSLKAETAICSRQSFPTYLHSVFTIEQITIYLSIYLLSHFSERRKQGLKCGECVLAQIGLSWDAARGEELAEHQIFYWGWGPQGREATVAARDARTEVIRKG